MELRNLEYFVALAEENSFEKAARRLFLTQSAVSQQIRRLEADLGVRLIDRGTRPFQLTDAGRDVFAIATSIVRQANSIRGIAQDREGSASGIVRVGVTPALLFGRVTDAVREVGRANPTLRIELFNANTPEIQAQLESGAIDIAVSNTSGSVPSCQDELLYRDRLVIAFNTATYPALKGGRNGTVPLSLLDGLPIVSFARKDARANYDFMLGYFTEHDKSPVILEVVASYMDQVGYARAGLGVAVVPESLMRAVNVPYVESVQLEPPLPTIPIYATWDADSLNRSSAVFMKEFFHEFV